MIRILEDVMRLAERWPESAQLELAWVARQINDGLSGELYHPTAEELAGIDRGIKDVNEGRLATQEDVEQLFNKYRPT